MAIIIYDIFVTRVKCRKLIRIAVSNSTYAK